MSPALREDQLFSAGRCEVPATSSSVVSHSTESKPTYSTLYLETQIARFSRSISKASDGWVQSTYIASRNSGRPVQRAQTFCVVKLIRLRTCRKVSFTKLCILRRVLQTRSKLQENSNSNRRGCIPDLRASAGPGYQLPHAQPQVDPRDPGTGISHPGRLGRCAGTPRSGAY